MSKVYTPKCTQEQWDELCAPLSPIGRQRLSNMMAHSWNAQLVKGGIRLTRDDEKPILCDYDLAMTSTTKGRDK